MEEIAETTEQPQKPSFWDGVWLPVIFSLSSSILREFVSFSVAWILAGVLATCVGYFIPPKPKVGFIKFFVVMQAGLLVTLVTIWFVPPLLQNIIPIFWAYALPALLLINGIYFVPPLDGSKRDTAWWKWFLGSLVFAGIFGWFSSSLEK